MHGLDKRHISEQVLIYLRKKIMLQKFNEGMHLKESELSKELTVSRGPIREAISRLEAEGLVETPANGRTIVRKFGVQDVRHLYETRILLECYALSKLDPVLLKDNIHLLYEYVYQMESKIKDVESDIAFHYLIVKMTGNKTLIRLWNSMNEVIKTLIEVTTEFTVTRQHEIVADHRVIVDALKIDDVEKAQELLRYHLKDASDYYSKAVFQMEEEEK